MVASPSDDRDAPECEPATADLTAATLRPMAILVDGAIWPWRGRRWAHLVSDASYDELHEFAGQLGIPRRAFQGDHYDIHEDLRIMAVSLGAVEVDGRVSCAACEPQGYGGRARRQRNRASSEPTCFAARAPPTLVAPSWWYRLCRASSDSRTSRRPSRHAGFAEIGVLPTQVGRVALVSARWSTENREVGIGEHQRVMVAVMGIVPDRHRDQSAGLRDDLIVDAERWQELLGPAGALGFAVGSRCVVHEIVQPGRQLHGGGHRCSVEDDVDQREDFAHVFEGVVAALWCTIGALDVLPRCVDAMGRRSKALAQFDPSAVQLSKIQRRGPSQRTGHYGGNVVHEVGRAGSYDGPDAYW